jgi:hypothetical protein
MTKRIKQARASKVREFILMNTDISAKFIADKFSVPLQTVYNLRYHLKKKLAEKGQELKRSANTDEQVTQVKVTRIEQLLNEWSNAPVEIVPPKTPQQHVKDILDNWQPPKTITPVTAPILESEWKNIIQPDPVNHPAHYTHGGIETIDFIQAKLTPEEFRGYLKGNILKYGSRLGHKDNDMQDAGKLAWYTNKLRSVLATK